MKALLLLAVFCASTPAAALRLSSGPKSEDQLRRFIAGDPALRAKLDDAKRREAQFREESRETDLRDAVSDTPMSRAELLEQLPGMKAPASSACASLADCATPELATSVESGAPLADAVRALVRPWLVLQQARGRRVELIPAAAGGDALLLSKLGGLDAEPLVLNVSPKLLGGFNLWFDRPFELAALYERERALISARR